jgi:hypothetical protein
MLIRRVPAAAPTLTRPARIVLVVLTVLAALMACPAVSRADIGGKVSCNVKPQPAECQVIVVIVVSGEGDEQDGGSMRCLQSGRQVPCFVAGQGWLHSDGCRYLRQGSADPPPGASRPGAWYQRNCTMANGAASVLVWFANRNAPGIDPVITTALARLRLGPPDIRMSPRPPAAALVNVPTWLWVDSSTWTTRTATAAAGGAAITATATPTSVTWLPGDGTRLVCNGPGVAWSGGRDPLASPACSHIYARASAAVPGGVYRLRATVTWQITWQGAGMSGVAEPLTTTATVAVRVAEVQGLNVRVPR